MTVRKKDIVAVIGGTGDDRRAVEGVAAELARQGRLALLGPVPGEPAAVARERVAMAGQLAVANRGGAVGALAWDCACHARLLGMPVHWLRDPGEELFGKVCERRLRYAERLAHESLDALRHLNGGPASWDDHPSIRCGGAEVFDPWVTPEAHAEPWSSHDDPAQAQDPFAAYGRARVARFVGQILDARGRAESCLPGGDLGGL